MGKVLACARRLAFEVLASVVAPPPPVDYERWAIENISFSERESRFRGNYNPAIFPHFSEILKALGPADPCRTVTFAKSAQLGGTVLANVFTLGSLAMDPRDLLYVHPTEENGKRWSKMKLAPMLRSTTSMAGIFANKSRDGSDSVLYKERVDGRAALQISGANSPSSLSQISMPRQVQDDLAKWELNAAGDPEQQADSRSRGYEFAKIFKISTPLVVPGCRITKNFEAGSQEYYHVPCPHCSHMQTLDWENFLSNLDEEAPEKACFSCIECGGMIEEYQRPEMLLEGQWIARNPKAMREHRSFFIWSAYSPLQSFERIAREYIKAKGDPAAEQVFENDTLGRPYRTSGEAPPWEEIRKRADEIGHARGTIPAGGLLLTIGIDCQQHFVAWQAVSWSRDGRRFIVDHGTIDGHISDEGCRKGLNQLIDTGWRNSAGHDIKPDLVGIDGNAWTEDVWEWAKRHPTSKVIMLRGVGDERAPLIARVKRERNRTTGKVLSYSTRFYNFATSILKMGLYRQLLKADPIERGFVGIPAGLEDAFFKEFTAERRKPVRRKDGFISYQWVKDPNQANEMLDTHLQAEAAAIKFGLRTLPESRWDQYEAERLTPKAEGQMDLEDILFGNVPAQAQAQAPAPETRRHETAFERAARLLNG